MGRTAGRGNGVETLKGSEILYWAIEDARILFRVAIVLFVVLRVAGFIGGAEGRLVSPLFPKQKDLVMSWDVIAGNWKQMTGKVKEQWGKLTDDDIAKIAGKREQLEGALQEKYGYAKDKASAEVDSWIKTHK
jgi:uncharacterized protein YjbJ (UPF0337 family)